MIDKTQFAKVSIPLEVRHDNLTIAGEAEAEPVYAISRSVETESPNRRSKDEDTPGVAAPEERPRGACLPLYLKIHRSGLHKAEALVTRSQLPSTGLGPCVVLRFSLYSVKSQRGIVPGIECPYALTIR